MSLHVAANNCDNKNKCVSTALNYGRCPKSASLTQMSLDKCYMPKFPRYGELLFLLYELYTKSLFNRAPGMQYLAYRINAM
jgi:hypothetical protein